MIKESKFEIFKKYFKGSRKYFLSTLGFSKTYRDDIAIVYNFFRYVDDSVDMSNDYKKYQSIRNEYYKGLKKGLSNDPIINDFFQIKKKVGISDEWINALFLSMEMDINKKTYSTYKEVEEYTFGVAEVVGLTMSKIMNLPEESYEYARSMGRAAQWSNFLRDIGEDYRFGRQYFPQDHLDKFGLKDFSIETIKDNYSNYLEFIKFQTNIYYELIEVGEIGYKYISRNELKPLLFANYVDKWRVEFINKYPLYSYFNKVTPSLLRMIYFLLEINIHSIIKRQKSLKARLDQFLFRYR